jgi:ArsR family transcriptional regulator
VSDFPGDANDPAHRRAQLRSGMHRSRRRTNPSRMGKAGLTAAKPSSIVRRMSKSRPLDLNRAAALFKVLGHPHRLAILLRLCDKCDASACKDEDAIAARVGDVVKGLRISASTVSHHLKELRQAGVISTQREGQHVHCCPNLAVIEQLSAFIGERCCST